MLRVREAGAGLIARSARQWSRRLAFGLAVCSAVVVCGGTSFGQIRRPTGRPAAPPATRHPPLKAIFEPVSYPDDVDISDVFFVDRETGWACGHHRTAAGEGGFIVGTRDGGRTWSVQLGDPSSPARAVARVFFVDATHGWAAQADGVLLQTTNGATWTHAGTLGAPRPFVFVSPERGLALDQGGSILLTGDGGRTWTRVYQCRAGIDVAGPPGDPTCELETLAFAPDHATGYVVTRARDGHAADVIKTTDAGETWTRVAVIPGTAGTEASLAFPDPDTGYLRTGNALIMTTDGGRTWHAVTATVPDGTMQIAVAGPVGWMVGSHIFSYTLDGGKRWIARPLAFPAHVASVSLPATDTGYVAGSHGMIYRYRIVPFDYSAPHMLVIQNLTTFSPDSP